VRLLSILFFLGLSNCLAQNTGSAGVSISPPSVAIVNIAPNNTGLTFNVTAPTGAGVEATTSTNNTKWLNFTSAVAPGVTRSIRVQIIGTLPTGVSLNLATSTYLGSGAGTLGIPVSSLVLSTTSQAVVNGIGGAFTGDGTNNGYNLTYSLTIANYALLRSQSSTISIIYTIVDN